MIISRKYLLIKHTKTGIFNYQKPATKSSMVLNFILVTLIKICNSYIIKEFTFSIYVKVGNFSLQASEFKLAQTYII